jgi:hypothetical protein
MSILRSTARAAWEFVVGDDWRTALGVCAALGVVAVLAGLGLAAWWVMPLAVAALLWASLRRFAHAPRVD